MKLTKIFTRQQIKEIDRITIEKRGITSAQLMEEAVDALLPYVLRTLKPQQKVHIWCGTGNNGGDGLVLARKLKDKDFPAQIIIVDYSDKHSPEFDINLKRAKEKQIPIYFFSENLPSGEPDVIIDAIFGVGLNRPATGLARKAIEKINDHHTQVISIDLPSGLYADHLNAPEDAIVQARKVFTFQFPKLSFFFKENQNYVPSFEIVDIGLDREAIKNMSTNKFYVESIDEFPYPRPKFSDKSHYGHAMIIGGSAGKAGAVVFASRAALRTGAGWTSAYVPKKLVPILQSRAPEIMLQWDKHKKRLENISPSGKKFAFGIGPGMGTHKKTANALEKFLRTVKEPVVLDADALNILSLYSSVRKNIPAGSILTPHEGELRRLSGDFQSTPGKWEKAKNLANALKSIVIAKGAYTLITNGEKMFFNSTGNPALAKAGSGDVLTGILTGLLAQNRWDSLTLALLGTYIHGKLANLYTEKYKDFSLLPGDLIEMLKDFPRTERNLEVNIVGVHFQDSAGRKVGSDERDNKGK